VAFNPTTHHAFVAWSSDDGSVSEIQGRMVNANLTLGPQRFFDYTLGPLPPAMTYANLGDSYLVVWYDGYDLISRWVDSDGGLEGQNFFISFLGAATAVAFGFERYMVTWTGGSGLDDIFGWLEIPYPSKFLPLILR
jgi:hypothetical protein